MKDVNIEFTSLLNKISQMYVNKKLLNSAKISTGKINLDSDEIIYLTEIISYYFNEYKTSVDNEDDDDDTLDENKNEEISNITKPLQNNSELIKFMNKYSIFIQLFCNLFSFHT